jgi:hypothetical protein
VFFPHFLNYFCSKWQGAVGSIAKRGATIKKKALEDPLPKEEMIVWTKNHNLAWSLTKLHNPDNVALACSFFKDIHKHMTKGEAKPDHVLLVQNIIAYCLERQELRDEVLCQFIRQITNNPKSDSAQRGWQLLCCCIVAFPPSKLFYKYLLAFLQLSLSDAEHKDFVVFAIEALKKVKLTGPRVRPPSKVEIEAIRGRAPLVCRFYFLDGKAKAVSLHPTMTATDVVATVAEKVGLRSTDGWAIFEATPLAEHFIRGQDYLGDILASWEIAQRSSMESSKCVRIGVFYYLFLNQKKRSKKPPKKQTTNLTLIMLLVTLRAGTRRSASGAMRRLRRWVEVTQGLCSASGSSKTRAKSRPTRQSTAYSTPRFANNATTKIGAVS